MAEKKEVIEWIKRINVPPSYTATHFQNEHDWKVSSAQVCYWWKQAHALRSRLSGAGAKPRLADGEDILFDEILFRRS